MSLYSLFLAWYDENKRILPWRDQHNAYYTWVSEIMLQQTRVEAVKPYFERFIRELPDIPALAACPEEKLSEAVGRAWLLQPRPQHAAGSPGDGRKI